VPGARADKVNYLSFSDARIEIPRTERLPFLKRLPFRDENEFRIIYECRGEKLRSFNIPIDLSCIDEITISPWMAKALFPDIEQLLRSIEGCSKLKIRRSTLIGNDEWKSLAADDTP